MKKRIISAIIMIAILIPIIYYGGYVYKIFMALLSVLAIWELFNLEKNVPKSISLLFYIFNIGIIFYKELTIDEQLIIPIMAIFIIIIHLANRLNTNNDFKLDKLLKCSALCMMNSFFFYGLVHLRDLGLNMAIYAVMVSMMTDTFALLCGKKFGKHKLCPKISPNKTIEGSIGGTLLGTLTVLLIFYFIDGTFNWYLMIGITILLTVVGQIGDLFFSNIKRFYQVKDYSNLIPGHGGVLDRCDNLLFVASFLMILAKYI